MQLSNCVRYRAIMQLEMLETHDSTSKPKLEEQGLIL